MYNKCLLILSALLFASNNISFSMDDDIDFNIDFFPKSVNQKDIQKSNQFNTVNENDNNENSSFMNNIGNNHMPNDDNMNLNFDVFPKNVKQEEMDDNINFNIDFFPKSVNQKDVQKSNQFNTLNEHNNNEDSSFIKLFNIINNNVANDNNIFFQKNVNQGGIKQYYNISKNPCNNNTTNCNIVSNNIIQKEVKQYPINIRNLKLLEIDKVAFQKSIQQYMAQMSNNIKQRVSNNIIEKDTTKITTDGNNIKLDNNTESSRFKNLFDTMKASEQNNKPQFNYSNIENIFNNNIQIQNSNLLNSLNNTSDNNIYNVYGNTNTQFIQYNKLFYGNESMPDKIQQYYQYNNQFYKTNYPPQNITNNHLKNNSIISQKDQEKNEIVSNNNTYNASKNINSSLIDSKKSKISNNKNGTNKNNKKKKK